MSDESVLDQGGWLLEVALGDARWNTLKADAEFGVLAEEVVVADDLADDERHAAGAPAL